MVTNANLQSARTARDDEFYTKYADVDAELSHYMPDLKGRRVYCGADGPESMFVRWMLDHWDALELSGLTATQFNPLAPLFGRGARYDWTRPDQNPVESALYDGDLLGDECRAILDASDVFISNPPFSLMRHILPMLGDSGKRFCVLGTLNMLKYNGVFDLILSERLWAGVNTDGRMLFERPDGSVRRFSNCVWLTNMEAPLRVCPPFTPGAGIPSAGRPFDERPEYTDFDSLNALPADFDGVAGVPLNVFCRFAPTIQPGGWSAKWTRAHICRQAIRPWMGASCSPAFSSNAAYSGSDVQHRHASPYALSSTSWVNVPGRYCNVST